MFAFLHTRHLASLSQLGLISDLHIMFQKSRNWLNDHKGPGKKRYELSIATRKPVSLNGVYYDIGRVTLKKERDIINSF